MRCLMILLVLLLPVQALADGGIYLKGSLGIFMVDDSELRFEGADVDASLGNVISNTGFGANGAIGLSLGDFDVELEFGYREGYLYRQTLIQNQNYHGSYQRHHSNQIRYQKLFSPNCNQHSRHFAY